MSRINWSRGLPPSSVGMLAIVFLISFTPFSKAKNLNTSSYKFIQIACTFARAILDKPLASHELEQVRLARHCHAYLLGMHAMMKNNCTLYRLKGGLDAREFRAGGNPKSSELVFAYTEYAMSSKANLKPATARFDIPIALSQAFPCKS